MKVVRSLHAGCMTRSKCEVWRAQPTGPCSNTHTTILEITPSHTDCRCNLPLQMPQICPWSAATPRKSKRTVLQEPSA
eukprot:1160285-Pelagomonas_calceolata.AAC.4